MSKEFYVTKTGVKRVVYTTKSGAKYIRSQNKKRYLTKQQIKDSHKRIKNPKSKKPKVKNPKSKKPKVKKSIFSMWGGWGGGTYEYQSYDKNYEKIKTVNSSTY